MQTQMSNIKPLSVKPYIKRNKQYDFYTKQYLQHGLSERLMPYA